jgi:hypothetical protein
VSVDAVPAAQLRHVARAADALGHGIERVLDRIDPGLGRDAHVIAGLMRAHVPVDDRPVQAVADAPSRDAATI